MLIVSIYDIWGETIIDACSFPDDITIDQVNEVLLDNDMIAEKLVTNHFDSLDALEAWAETGIDNFIG